MRESLHARAAREVASSMVNAELQFESSLPFPERLWWKAESARWSAVWSVLDQVLLAPADDRTLRSLRTVASAARDLYEQFVLAPPSELDDVPAASLHEEAVRWRRASQLIGDICKNGPVSAIRVVERS